MPLSLIQLDDNEILFRLQILSVMTRTVIADLEPETPVEDSFQNSVVSRKAEFFMLATYYWLLTTEIQT
jgi:hypothetical protein